MKTYKYKQIKININMEEPDNIKLLSVLDGYNAWERNHMILEVLLDKFVLSQPVSTGISDVQSKKNTRQEDYHEEINRLMETVTRLSEKVSILDERMKSTSNVIETVYDAYEQSEMHSDDENVSKKVSQTMAALPEKEEKAVSENKGAELPPGVMEFLSAL